MLRPICQIKITQVPTADLPNRTSVFNFSFANEIEVTSSWKNLTDTAKIKLPKNVIISRADGSRYALKDVNKSINGRQSGNDNPFVLRGDKIEIQASYIFIDRNGKEIVPEPDTIFTGYISKVKNKMPIELDCEDNMYLLKQKFIDKKSYANAELTQVLTDILQDTGFTFTTGGATMSLGNFRVENQTIAEVLEYLRKTFHIESFFRGDVLHAAPFVYYPDTNNNPPHLMQFQKNIISDEMQYTRADDVKIGVKAYSISKAELTTQTFDGRMKNKATRLEVFATKDNTGKVIFQNLTGGLKTGIDEGSFGNVVTLFYADGNTLEGLKKFAAARLNRLYYEGFRGTFTTFGLPFVQHGDQIQFTDYVLPERNGIYFVKSVVRTYGMSGYRQKIEIDLRIDGVLNKQDLDNGI
jgi:hypothetical protein